MRYVALMRGFGPSDPNMRGDKLREFFTSLGFSNVHAILASGNVIFDSNIGDAKKLEDKIQKALPNLLGFSRAVIVRSQPQLEALAASEPYKDLEHSNKSYLLVTFFKDQPDSSTLTLPNFYGVGGVNALCSSLDNTSTGAQLFMPKLDKQFGKNNITSRTWLTIQRILKKLEQTK